MTKASYDVAIVGAGPGGSTAATLLSQAGYRVGVFDKERFPRFHVGESLIPAVNYALRRLGVLDRMDAWGFPRKHAVQFLTPRGPSRPFYFRETADPLMHHTWQVRRSEFDRMLLERAQEVGAEAFLDQEVVDFLIDGDRVHGFVARGADGRDTEVRARVVLDASGTYGVLGKRLGERRQVPGLTNTGVFAHFEGVRLDPGIDAGSTLIYRVDAKSWLWQIPLPDAVSIGVVAPAGAIGRRGATPQEILENAIPKSPELADRMQGAKRVSDVHAVRDFTYIAERDGGPGWGLIGDALGFVDPMYSTGLFLTTHSAELACARIDERMCAGDEVVDLRGFAAPFRLAFERFVVMVQAYYRDDFHFGTFARVPGHRQGMIDMLTGLVRTPAAVHVVRSITDWDAETGTGETIPLTAAPAAARSP